MRSWGSPQFAAVAQARLQEPKSQMQCRRRGHRDPDKRLIYDIPLLTQIVRPGPETRHWRLPRNAVAVARNAFGISRCGSISRSREEPPRARYRIAFGTYNGSLLRGRLQAFAAPGVILRDCGWQRCLCLKHFSTCTVPRDLDAVLSIGTAFVDLGDRIAAWPALSGLG